MPLFRVENSKQVTQIKPAQFSKERELQRLFEDNLEVLMGVRFIGSEFTTGDRQRGRIDTLGIDQDGSPTIVEYKKTSKENIINQGLFYMDWLVDHKGDFTIAAQEACGPDVLIDWSNPRLILIAESFSEYDKYAVNRIGAYIELWTYRRYGEGLLYLEPLFVAEPKKSKSPAGRTISIEEGDNGGAETYTVDGHLSGKTASVQELFEALRDRIFDLGGDEAITETANKTYISYKHGKNFAEVRLQAGGIKFWIDIPYSELDDPYKLGRDVSNIGHYGTGLVEVKFSDPGELDKVMDLIEQSFKQTV